MSITTALKARREALRDREAGFTLIELLVVVIIIGILAAIAIPIYLGVQNNAKDSSVKSDLTNEKTSVEAYATQQNGVLPTPAFFTKANLGSFGFTQNTDDMPAAPKLSVGTGAYADAFCIDATSVTGKAFAITSGAGVGTVTCATLTQTKW